MKRLSAIILIICLSGIYTFAKRIEGFVRYSSRGLPGVIVTDGEAFTRTNGEGYFRLEVSPDARYVQVVPPYGFAAASDDGFPTLWQEAEGRLWFNFELSPTSPATDFTIFAVTLPQIADEEALVAFEADFVPDLVHQATSARIKGLTMGVVNAENVAQAYLQKVKKLLTKAKIPFYMTADGGPSEKAFFAGKDLVLCAAQHGGSMAEKLLPLAPEGTNVIMPEVFLDFNAGLPEGYKILSRTGGRLEVSYHCIRPSEAWIEAANQRLKSILAHLVFRDKTMEAFENEAVELAKSGVDYLEASLQLTDDRQVVVLRDRYPKFTSERSVDAASLIDRVDEFTGRAGRKPLRFAFAVNSGSGTGEGTVWPEYKEFADRCLGLLLDKGLEGRLLIESFDDRVLRYIHNTWPQIELCYLVDTQCGDFQEYMGLLDFTPGWLGVQYEMLDKELIAKAHQAGMRIAVWDINNPDVVDELLETNIDSIIIDAPACIREKKN